MPGMFANVNAIAGAPLAVVTLPRTAVTFSLYGDSVFVVKPAGPEAGAAQAAPVNGDLPFKVERRFVRTGDTRGDRVAILEGIQAGEMVVTEGQLKLQPDARVRIDPNARLAPPAIRPKE